MKCNTTGKVAEPPKKYITEAGKYVFKIEKFEDDGYTNGGEQKLKAHYVAQRIIMVEGKATLSEDVYTMTENNLSMDENLAWLVLRIRDALKSPENFDTEDWVGRFLIADIYMREHGDKKYATVSGYSYSKQNDKLPPIPEAKSAEDVVAEVVTDISVGDIDEDEIPF